MTRFGLILVFGSLLIGESLAATSKPVTKSLTPLADAAATQNDAERDKRGLDLGLLLRNVLLKSADLSNYKADVSRAKAAKVTTTRAPRKRPTTRKPAPFVPLQKPFPPPFGGYGPVKVSISGPSAQAYGPPNGFRGPSGPALAPFGKAGFHNYANYDDDDYDYDYDGNLLVASGAQATTTSTTIRPTGKRRKPGQRNNLPYGPPAPFYGSPSGRFNKQGGYMYFENAYNNARRQQQAAGQNANNQQPQQEQQQPAAGNGNGGGGGTGTVTRQQLTNKLLYQYAQQDDIYSNNAKSAAANTAAAGGDGDGANASNSSPNDNNNDNSNNNDVQYLNINPNASDDDDDEDDDDIENDERANDEIYNTQNKNIYDYNTPKTNNNNDKNYEYRNDYNDAEDGEDIAQPIANPASTLTAPEYTNQNIDTTPQKPPYYIAAGEETYELPSAFGLQQQQQEEPYHYFVLRPTEQQQQQQAIDQLSPQLEPVNSQYQNYGTGSDNGGNGGSGGGNGGSDVAIAFNDFETSHNSDPRYTSYTTVHK